MLISDEMQHQQTVVMMTSPGVAPGVQYVVVDSQLDPFARRAPQFKNKRAPTILGSIQIVVGVLCIVFNSITIATDDVYNITGVGIWGGALASADISISPFIKYSVYIILPVLWVWVSWLPSASRSIISSLLCSTWKMTSSGTRDDDHNWATDERLRSLIGGV